MMSSLPVWAEGLKKLAHIYYEGYVEDLERTLELHRRHTVTTWDILRSQRKQPAPGMDGSKKNVVSVQL